jgi:hypothetical protein
MFMIGNQIIPLKNSLGPSAVVCCACDLILLFPVMLCLVKDVQNC